ncbi:hypothetical protein, partial [Accumulibacter sp.]|uniref:hypothetical protein n=1 Tax=Accumulibacter sp. TaxID=2053492 RepID=UPI002618BB3A
MPQIAIQTASYLIAAVLLFLTLHLHLVPALFAGLLVFVIIDKMSPWLYRLSKGRASHLAASIIVAAVAVLLVSLGAVALIGLLKNGNTSGLPELWEHLADIIDDANDILPPWIVERLPSSADSLRTLVVGWLHEHTAELQGIGKELAISLVHVLVGGILGALIAVTRRCDPSEGALAVALRQRVATFERSFEQVFIGQGKISCVNTFFTGIYLAVVLPLCGIHLPFVKTMLVITLIVCCLPVIGNLTSNTIIFVVSASVSFPAALASL